MNIRNYRESDFEVISSWWKDANEIGPTKDLLPLESTFVLEINNEPKACITVYLTNCHTIAYLENFIKDPKLENSRELTKELVKYAEDFTHNLGYKILICFAFRDKLKNRYKELGYKNSLDNLSSFVKEL